MIDPEEQYSAEVKERLAKIAFYLEQRDSHRRRLSLFRGSDFDPKSSQAKDFQAALQRLSLDDENTLSEIFHLREGVERYFTAQGIALDSLKAVSQSKPFKVIASFVNSVKHGTHGKGVLSTRTHSVVLHAVKRGPQSSASDPIHDARLLINYDGELLYASELASKVIFAWIVLFAEQPTNPFKEFEATVKRLNEKTAVLSVYRLAIPEGLARQAEAESEARKNIGRPAN